MSETPTIPDGYKLWYECERGHLNPDHNVIPGAPEGKQCVCKECGTLLTKHLVSIDIEEAER